MSIVHRLARAGLVVAVTSGALGCEHPAVAANEPPPVVASSYDELDQLEHHRPVVGGHGTIAGAEVFGTRTALTRPSTPPAVVHRRHRAARH